MMSPFSSTRHQPLSLHRRRESSSSSASTSSCSSTSPVTSPSRPPHARRKLEFSESLEARDGEGGLGCGSHPRARGEASEDRDDEMASSLKLFALELDSKASRSVADGGDGFHPMFRSPTSAYSRQSGPGSPSPPVLFRQRVSPLSFSPSPSLQRPTLSRRPPFAPSSPVTVRASAIVRPSVLPPPLPLELPVASGGSPRRQPLSKSTSCLPKYKPQPVQRLRSTSSSMNSTPSSSRAASPSESPRLALSERSNGSRANGAVSPLLSPDAAQARPSPDAFKETLMRKSSSGSSFTSGFGFNSKAALGSPALPIAKSPLHLDGQSLGLPVPSSYLGKENVAPRPETGRSPAPSMLPRGRSRTSYFSSSTLSPTASVFESDHQLRAPRLAMGLSASTSSLRSVPPPLFSPSQGQGYQSSSSSCPLSHDSAQPEEDLDQEPPLSATWTPMKPSKLLRTKSRLDLSSIDLSDERSSPNLDLQGLGLGLPSTLEASFASYTYSARPPPLPLSSTSHHNQYSPKPAARKGGLKRKGSAAALSSNAAVYSAPFLTTTPSPSSRRRSAIHSVAAIASGMAEAPLPDPASSSPPRFGVAGPAPKRPTFKRTTADEDKLASQFDVVEVLGRGIGGVVWKVVERASGTVGAVKVSTVYAGARDRVRHLEELDILRLFSLSSSSHPNIITLSSAWECSARLHIHTPLYECGDLEAFLSALASLAALPLDSLSLASSHFHDRFATGALDEPRAWKLVVSLASALQHAHALGVLHMDVKPGNVLVDESGEVKLGDWGHATRWPRKRPSDIVRGAGLSFEWMNTAEGTGLYEDGGSSMQGFDREGDRDYLSPEGVRGVVGPEGDVFSLGLLLLEALTAIVPPPSGEPWQRLRSDDFSDLENSDPTPSPSPFHFFAESPFSSTQSLSPSSSAGCSRSSSSNFDPDLSLLTTGSASSFSAFSAFAYSPHAQMPAPTLSTLSNTSFASSTASTAFVPLTQPWASPALTSLVKRMMSSDPASRPSMAEIGAMSVVQRVSARMEREGRATLVDVSEEDAAAWLADICPTLEGTDTTDMDVDLEE